MIVDIYNNKCYREWYKNNKTCIICRDYAYPPNSMGKRMLLRDLRNYNISRNPRYVIEDPLIIKVCKIILFMILFYFIFIKPKIKQGEQGEDEI